MLALFRIDTLHVVKNGKGYSMLVIDFDASWNDNKNSPLIRHLDILRAKP